MIGGRNLSEKGWHRSHRRRAILRGGLAAAALAGLGTLGCGSGGPKKSSGAAATIPSGTPYKLANSWTGQGAPEAVLFAALDQGIFKKNGLDVSLTQIVGPTAIAALLSGQVQAADAGGGEVLASAAQGTDVVDVAVQVPAFTGKFYVSPDIKSPADLKGKKMATGLPGGSGDQTLRLALLKLGLQPDKDVTLIPVNGAGGPVAALLNGAVQGTLVNAGPDTVKADSQGFVALVDFATMGLPPAATWSIAMRRSFIAAHPDLAQKYVDSIVEGTVLLKRNKGLALTELAKIYKTDDQASLGAAYDYFYRDAVMPSAPSPKADLFKPLQDTLCNSRKIEAACGFDLNKAVEPSLVGNAVKRGLAT